MPRSMLIGLMMLLTMVFHASAGTPGSFAVNGRTFVLNGKPFIIHSGEVHYPRIPREYWRERLHTVHAMGVNTICTYIFWDLHEPEPGRWDFSGDNDVAEFIRLAQKERLYVIVRLGPYVCTEWDFGGLPAWLLRDPEIRVRCMDKGYMAAVKRYVDRLGKELVDLQIDHGGPIIMMQVENEYGSYGNDTAYTRALAGYFRDAGFTIPFYTSDGPNRAMLGAGTIPGILPVVNFGEGAQQAFRELEAFRPGVPAMCGEYWCGWFTHWGDSLWGRADTKSQLEEIRWMVKTGKSFNLYMAHGGTNFGWMAGANFGKAFEPDVTSYDYDAPVDETGRPRGKYFAIREILTAGEKTIAPSNPRDLISIDPFPLAKDAPLFDNLSPGSPSPQIYGMEHFGQNHGFILYRTHLIGPNEGTLTITDPHDLAIVLLDGTIVGSVDRRLGQTSLVLPHLNNASPQLDILVEAFGRVNFGSHLLDRKGITERVTLNGITLMNWEVFPLPMDSGYRSQLHFRDSVGISGPGFHRGSFSVKEPGDTFLDMSGWREGIVWVNGKNLGRFWGIGPQRKLYLPGVWLRAGENDVMVFDLEGGPHGPLRGVREPDFPAN
ncbi:MAG: beta-galactosidase family protein [Bacteroidota bacterium]